MTDNALTAKRVGQYLIDAGVLKASQLDEALDRQKRMSKAGFHVLLGTILEEMGAIDRQSLEAIILRQRLDEGSVSLGADADWSAFRAAPEVEPAQPEGNGAAPPEAVAPAVSEDTDEMQAAPAEVHGEAAEAAAPESASQMEVSEQAPAEMPQAQIETEAPVNENQTMALDAVTSSPEEGAVQAAADQEPAPALAQGESTAELESHVEPEAQMEPEAPEYSQSSEPMPDHDEVAQTEVAETDVTQQAETAEEEAVGDHDVAVQAQVAMEAPVYQAEPEGVPPASETAPVDEAEPELADTAARFATDEMGEAQPASSTGSSRRVEVHGFSFPRSFNGLEETEVSAVLSRLLKHTQALEKQLDDAKEDLAHLDSMRRYGEQTIKAADTIADQIHAEAEKQAAAIRDRAQQEARRIVADARVRHDQIMRASGERAKQVAEEIRKNIEDHRAINDHMFDMAEQLIAGDPENEV